MTAKLARYFRDYDAYHATRGNEVCHSIGIPLILVATLGLLALLKIGPLDAGLGLWMIATFWYLTLDWKIAAPFSFFTLAGYFLGRAIPPVGLISIFVLGWVFQGVGHALYEKRSPAFFQNFIHLLIGPLWIYGQISGISRKNPSSSAQK